MQSVSQTFIYDEFAYLRSQSHSLNAVSSPPWEGSVAKGIWDTPGVQVERFRPSHAQVFLNPVVTLIIIRLGNENIMRGPIQFGTCKPAIQVTHPIKVSTSIAPPGNKEVLVTAPNDAIVHAHRTQGCKPCTYFAVIDHEVNAQWVYICDPWFDFNITP